MTEPLRPLNLSEALAEADKHDGGGRRRARELAEQFAPVGDIVLRTFGENEREAFLDIAWQEIDATRYLTPSASPRTLRAAATRIRDEFGSFGALVQAEPRPGLVPEWFGSCVRIEREGFDWSKWLRPWLVPAVDSERRHSPATHLYVWEGVHSTVVLALGLLDGSLVWRPVEAVVSLQRPA